MSVSDRAHPVNHRDFFRGMLQDIYDLIGKEFGLSQVSVRPIGAEGSRLSLPIKIEGVDRSGKEVKYFGKILGSSDLLTAKTIQFFKNLYLDMSSMDPLFEVLDSAEELARHQYETLQEVGKLGIPTAKAYGVYPLKAKMWLLILEFVQAQPISDLEKVTEEQVDTVFGYLHKMHRNGLFHGDIKPDNLMFGERIYIVDVGNFAKEAPRQQKLSYDLACQVASFVDYMPAEDIIRIARKYYSGRELRAAARYLDIVQRRPDIKLSDEDRELLLDLMK